MAVARHSPGRAAWDVPSRAETCCGRWHWHDGRRWRCGACDAPPPGSSPLRAVGGPWFSRLAADAAAARPVGKATEPDRVYPRAPATHPLVVDAGW